MVRGRIAADGTFTLPAIRLRKQTNNSFEVAFHAPRAAPHAFRFSAICLDCLATPQ